VTIVLDLCGSIAAGGIGALLLGAGIAKLRAHDVFLTTLASYRLVPEALLEPGAWLMGLVETALGAVLLLGLAPGVGAVGSGIMFGVFALAMGINLARGRTDLSCGCMPGIEGGTLSWRAVMRTVVLAFVAFLSAFQAAGLLRVEGVAAGVCFFLLALACAALQRPDEEAHA
jgi:hypothetical protein